MASTIRFKRGGKATIPVLSSGEPGWTTDTNELFIGTGSGNIQIARQSVVDAHTNDTTIHFTQAEISITKSQISDFSDSDYVLATEKGAANGVATLDANSKIPTSQLPAIAITDVNVVADIPARDALTVQEGDVAIVQDDGTGQPNSYIYDGTAWQELEKPADTVTSVNGYTGVVVLTTDDISEGSTHLYYTDARVSANSDVSANTAARHTHANKTVLDGISSGDVTNWDAAYSHATTTTGNPHQIATTDLTDVGATGFTDGQGLVWSNTAGNFQAVDLATQAELDSAISALVLNDLSDVSTFDLSVGEALIYDGSSWTNQEVATQAELDALGITDLSDVSVSGLASGQGLVYNGTSWVNVDVATQTELNNALANQSMFDHSDVVSVSAGDGQALVWSNANSGFVAVDIATQAELNALGLTDLSDVSGTGLATGYGLLWNGTQWVPTDLATQAELDSVSSGVPSVLNDLGDVSTSALAAGEALVWDGTQWTNIDVATQAELGALSIGDLADVTITSVASGQGLVWNGTAWVNQDIATQAELTAHTGDSTIHFTQSQISITKSQISDFTESDYIHSSSTSTQTVVVTSASATPLVLKGASGQTANLLELQNSSGTAVAYVDASGDAVFNSVSALVDGGTW